MTSAEPLTEVISSGELYLSLVMMPDGSSVRIYSYTHRGSANTFLERDEAVKVHDALGRLLKATSPSVTEAVERERANA